MMTLDLVKLRVFVTVVDRNGYSAAAEHLGLSQATVSFHIHGLERQLATPLVRYEQRTVRLTPVGERVYRSARRMLTEEQRLVRSIRGGHSDVVSFGASMAFEQAGFFDQVIAPFRRSHPDVLLSVRFGHSVALAEAVRDGELDLAHLIGWHVPSGLRYEPLHRSTFTFMVAHQHPLAQRTIVTVDDLAQAGLIAAPLDDVEWAHYKDVLDKVGLGAHDVTLHIDGIQARVLAARAGLGVLGMFCPPYADPQADPPLAQLTLDRASPTVEVGIVERRGQVPTEAVLALADLLRQQAAGAELDTTTDEKSL